MVRGKPSKIYPSLQSSGYNGQADLDRVNEWLFEPELCDGKPGGCRGGPIDAWEVTLLGFGTTPGEALASPSRNAQVYPGGYVALVLYADKMRLTLGFTREDTVAHG